MANVDQMTPVRRVIAWFLAWIALSAFIVVLIGNLNWQRYHALNSDGLATTGVVLGSLPHHGVSYSYSVDGRSYRGTGAAEPAEKDNRALNPGDAIQVAYLPSNPAVSCAGDPHKLYSNETTSIVLAGLLGPTFALVMVRIRMARFFK